MTMGKINLGNMYRHTQKLYLKWGDSLIGEIDNRNQVRFTGGNIICNGIIPNKLFWDDREFREFLSDRIISKNRRDIQFILKRLGMAEYDEIEIAKRTRAFNLNDRFWIAYHPDESYETTFISIFVEFFNNFKYPFGDAISSPGGQNEKNYMYKDGEFGIVKKRLHPYSTDTESEVIVYRLAKLLGVRCCLAKMVDAERVFSRYEYDFVINYMIHARRFLKDIVMNRQDYRELSKYFRSATDDIRRMIILDFITLQDDRHLSNWGILMDDYGNASMYNLYDNGRSLMYEYTPKMANDILSNPVKYSNSFGLVGTYYDNILDIREETKLVDLVNTNINNKDIVSCFEGLRLDNWKKEASIQYINWALNEIKKLG